MGAFAIRRPPTDEFRAFHVSTAGQHASPGKQRHEEAWEKSSSRGRALTCVTANRRVATIPHRGNMMKYDWILIQRGGFANNGENGRTYI
jgi:hypothetical protein